MVMQYLSIRQTYLYARLIYPPSHLENVMPSIDVYSPVSSAPTDRLALGVGWVRPGAAGIGGTLNPSGTPRPTPGGGIFICSCFEGSEE